MCGLYERASDILKPSGFSNAFLNIDYCSNIFLSSEVAFKKFFI